VGIERNDDDSMSRRRPTLSSFGPPYPSILRPIAGEDPGFISEALFRWRIIAVLLLLFIVAPASEQREGKL